MMLRNTFTENQENNKKRTTDKVKEQRSKLSGDALNGPKAGSYKT